MKCNTLAFLSILIFISGIRWGDVLWGVVASWEVINYFSILHTTPTGYLLDQLAHLMISIGTFTTFVGFQGCCGACCESVCMLCLYTLLIILVLIGELIIGIFIGVFCIKIAAHIAASMQQQVKFQYNRTLNTTHDLTLAWDLMHLRGCAAELLSWFKRHSKIFIGTTAGVVFLQLFGLILDCCLMTCIRREQSKYPWYIDDEEEE